MHEVTWRSVTDDETGEVFWTGACSCGWRTLPAARPALRYHAVGSHLAAERRRARESSRDVGAD